MTSFLSDQVVGAQGDLAWVGGDAGCCVWVPRWGTQQGRWVRCPFGEHFLPDPEGTGPDQGFGCWLFGCSLDKSCFHFWFLLPGAWWELGTGSQTFAPGGTGSRRRAEG